MARYSLGWTNITAAAVANTTNFTDSAYPFFLQGGNGTMRLNVYELFIGGEESASSNPTRMLFSRDSTVGATGISGTTNALVDGSGTAPGTTAVQGNVSTTKPQRSSTLQLLNLAFNAYGGIVRWVAAPGSEIAIVGNTASLGEASLSSQSGTGKTSGHCLYELA